MNIDIFQHIGEGGVTEAHLAAALDASTPGELVTLRISSPGGCAFAGMAMASLVKQHGNVHAIAMGLCASAATFPLFAAKKASMAREATLMLHSAYTNEAPRTSDGLRSVADLLDKLKAQIVDLYALRAQKTPEEVAAWVGENETWFNATEALAAGLIDEVTPADVVPINARWSFANAPASLAAQLDPVTAMAAEVSRLKSELAAEKALPRAVHIDTGLRGAIRREEERQRATDPLTEHKRRIQALRNFR